MTKSEPKRPVIFGEILFDIFPNGTEVLGGAPFNAAWNLHGLGLNPLLISRIGKDERGKTAMGAMARFGMDISGVQIDNFLPTGVVAAHPSGERKRLSLPEAQAFDAIEKEESFKAAKMTNPGLLYHGTLPARSKVALDSLLNLKEHLSCPTYADVNMRAPWVRGEVAIEMVKNDTCVQANRTDFDLMVGSCSFEGLDFLGMTGYLKDMTKVKYLIVTMGKDGAILSSEGSNVEFKQKEHPQIQDTFGCGDAFAAVIMAGMIKGWSIEVTVERANEMAGLICQIKGGVIEDKKFYEAKAKEWGI